MFGLQFKQVVVVYLFLVICSSVHLQQVWSQHTRKVEGCEADNVVLTRTPSGGVVNLEEKLALFSEHWTPKIIAELNDYQIKLVKLQGEFVWHDHEDTDELFMVVEGKMEIEFEDHTKILSTGELCVVPKGIRHKPKAEKECKVMLIEPRGVVNTGEVEGELTAENDVWI